VDTGTSAHLMSPVATTYSLHTVSAPKLPLFSFLVAFFLALGRFVKVVFSPNVSLALTYRRVEFVSFDYRSIRLVYG
jgi:hypothetical protein